MPEAVDIRKLVGTSVTQVVAGQGYFPVIAGLGGKECVVVLRGGAGHLGLGGRLDAVRSTDGGASWEAPVTITDSERDDRNPALGVAADGSLVLAYHWQGSYGADGRWDPENRHVDTRLVYSRDGGRTWEGDGPLDFAALNGASPFGKIRGDGEGTLYMPIYGGGPPLPGLPPGVSVGDGTTGTYVLRSLDCGHRWTDPTLVAVGLNEADLLLLPDGDWLFAARSEQRDEQAIYTCRSTDAGRTWEHLQQADLPYDHEARC